MGELFWLLVLGFIVYKCIESVTEPKKRSKFSPSGINILVTTSEDRWTDEIENPVKPDDVWIPAGQEITIGQFLIPGGMLYFGKDLSRLGSRSRSEPALINPALGISNTIPDLSECLTNYWPCYADISNSARAAYLTWLAGGKSDPDVDIGYVFLYFYGLERRVLADVKTSQTATSDIPAIMTEVERLSSIYGHSGSFRGYASRFLSFSRGHELSNTKRYHSPPPRTKFEWELPFELKVGLGQLVLDEKPIPEQWAFSWMNLDPNIQLRTPANRCPDEFEKLFKIHYRAKYRNGMTIKPNKTLLTLEYRPASASFSYSCFSHKLNLPDVSVLSRPANRFQEIASACCDELDAYSRYLGRNPDAKDSISSLALLPEVLASDTMSGEANELKKLLQSSLTTSSDALLEAKDLLHFWPSKNPEKLTKKESVQFTQLLERWGFGLEPDVRFGGKPLSSGEKVLIFQIKGETLSSPSREYSAAMLVLHLAAMVSAADGYIAAEEERHLETHLESALHLSHAERTRLQAHVKWLLAAQPSFTGIKKKLEVLGEHQRREISRFLVSVAGADGHIDPEEVKILTRMYKMMEIDETLLHSQLHEIMSTSTPAATSPVVVRAADQKTQGYKIPKEERSAIKQSSVSLDMERIRNTLTETAAVSALLGDIFTEEEPVKPFQPSTADNAHSIAGLDLAHSKLILRLNEQTTWAREELEQWVDHLGLMLDGALEVINEAAFDAADLPLCDGEDPIEIDHMVLKEMMA
jgi:tellurite resistance protein